MGRKVEIKINQISHDVFEIVKDNNFAHLMGIGYGFHKTIMQATSKADNMDYHDGEYFKSIIIKIENTDEETAILNSKELRILSEWIDSLCQMMLEMNTIDFKDKKIKKYFKLSENFVTKLKPMLGEHVS